ncbi:acetyil acetyltransferase [Cyclospora cayetanensis]|uniref:Acetyil acetyltransferase n=1 Tax=Cyclospora cayetanensis TaxID=88456 RepID=A0A1D3D660_9EIME|nr:acetyil acetyltransferase [Cyclospora cayetanensis]
MKRRFLTRGVVVLGGARTPIGSFLGSLRGVPPARLATAAAAGALQRSGIAPSEIQNCVVGQALTAGQGREAHRQAMSSAGLAPSAPIYRVDSGCASGLKAVTLAAASISLGEVHLALATGVESTSTAPHLLLKTREGGYPLGDGALIDSLVLDGLIDARSGSYLAHVPSFLGFRLLFLVSLQHADAAASRLGITRAACDGYAVESFKRAADAMSQGLFRLEGLRPVSTISPEVPTRIEGFSAALPQLQEHTTRARQQQQKVQQRGSVLHEDEEVGRLQLDRVASARPVFGSTGLLTPENSFKLGDGAAAVVLGAEEETRGRGLRPIAKILSFADAAGDSADLAGASEEALKRALRLAGLQRASLCQTTVNTHGGAISLGHPMGMTGTRMLLSLICALRARELTYGCAVISNGGDSATAVVVEAV